MGIRLRLPDFNIKNGDQVTLKMKLLDDSTKLRPEDVHIVLEAEQVVEITDINVRVAD